MINRISLYLLQVAMTFGTGMFIGHLAKAGGVMTKPTEPVTLARPIQKEEASDISKQGIRLMEAGDVDKALETFNRALALFRQTGNLEGEAKVLANIGMVYLTKQDWSKMREYCSQALALFKNQSNNTAVADHLIKIAYTFDMEKSYETAASYYQQAIPLLQAESDRPTRAKILIGIGTDFLMLKKTQSVVDLILKELTFFRGLNDPASEAAALQLVALAYNDVGRDREALPYYEQSLAAWVAAGERARQAGVLEMIAGIEHGFGNYEKALIHYDKSLVIWRDLKDRDSQIRRAKLLALLANFYMSLGDLRKATSYNKDALSTWQSLDDAAGQAGALDDLGRIWAYQGNRAQALSFYEKSLALWRSVKNAERESHTLSLMGVACEWAGEYQQAADYLNQSLTLCDQTGDRIAQADVLSKLGLVYARMIIWRIPFRNGVEMQNYLDQMLKLIPVLEYPPMQARILRRVGLMYSLLGNPVKALDCYHQALKLSIDSDDKAGAAALLWGIGYCYEQQNQPRQALEFYERSIEIHDNLRTSASLEEIKTGISGSSADVYKRAALLLQLGEPVRAFELSERARARTLLDQLANLRPRPKQKASAELQLEEQKLRAEVFNLEGKLKIESRKPASVLKDQIKTQLDAKKNEYEDLLIRIKLADPEYADLRAVNTLTLREMQPLIGKDTTLISYFVTDSQTLIFIITRDSFQSVKVDVNEEELIRDIDWFRHFGDLSDSAPEGLKRLYKLLIAPVIKYVKTPVVAIAPHGHLNYLPFAALTDGQRYFGEDHIIYYLPSASIIPFIHKTKARQQTGLASNRILVAEQSQTDGLSNLGRTEAEAVARLFRTKPFGISAASKATFLKLASDYSILHIAAHGELDAANPLFSRIWLAQDKDDDGGLTVHEVYDLELPKTDLVVLSACDTQLGAQSKGDDIIGLNRAFIYAGASTVIASLWVVDNKATTLLMRAFYTHLQRGKGKADALRLAQSDVRREYPNPYYWAAFILTGDAGLTNGSYSASRLSKGGNR